MFVRQNVDNRGKCFCTPQCYAEWASTQVGTWTFTPGDRVLVCDCYDNTRRARSLYQPECDCGRSDGAVGLNGRLPLLRR